MKNFKLLAIVTLFSLVFTSCSSDEEILIPDASSSLVDVFLLERTANHQYSIDVSIPQNAVVQNRQDVRSNTHDFYFYQADIVTTPSIMQQELVLDNSQLRINFHDENTGEQPTITVLDNDPLLETQALGFQLVNNFALRANGNGTFNMSFHVKKNVEVQIVFNKDKNVHEIHLEKGTGTIASFDEVFRKEKGTPLNIVFVNHLNNNASRSMEDFRKMPKFIIQ